MVIASSLLQNKQGKTRFLEEAYVIVDASMEVVLGMPFFPLSNPDIRFVESLFEGVTRL